MDSRPHSPAQLSCIPTHSSSTPVPLRCCCGRDDCAFLHNNQLALEGLEKDLATAAKLGEALLHRHESYMAEAEKDRHRLVSSVDSLEREKRDAQAENARIIAENRDLLEQLDGLNQAVVESDEHAKSLALGLENTEAELRRLTVSAARAADLEVQLAHMEAEQSRLHESLKFAQEDSKSAAQQWKKAECTLRDLHDQVDGIEKEARQERDHYSELVQRIERRQAVERELDGAAGRLKGAAAAQNLGRNHGDTNVVSRFVRDILQDNANLQMAIIELRHMLESSNQEVQDLRDQVLSHQPLMPADGDQEQVQIGATLNKELEFQKDRRVSQEYHVHHHHYGAPTTKKEKGATTLRLSRSKKRRSLGGYGLRSASGSQLARKFMHQPQYSASSTSTTLSKMSVSIPPTPSRRRSLQTLGTNSSTSSPQSGYQPLSIFDRAEGTLDLSQPTSPENTNFIFPLRSGRHKNLILDNEPRDTGSLDGINDGLRYGFDPSADPGDRCSLQYVIPEEIEESVKYASSERAEYPAPDDVFSSTYLQRHASHRNLLSVAGMDIHTPSHPPPRMRDLASHAVAVPIPRRIVSSGLGTSATPPVISTSTVTADRNSIISQKSDQSRKSLLASVGANRARVEAFSADSDNSDTTATPSRKVSLTRRMEGWARGRWGIVPTTSEHIRSPEETPASTCASPVCSGSSRHSFYEDSHGDMHNSKDDVQKQPISSLRFRYPGVNQTGPIPGLRTTPRTPASVHVQKIDQELLKESLAE